jgi:hypothetical protein
MGGEFEGRAGNWSTKNSPVLSSIFHPATLFHPAISMIKAVTRISPRVPRNFRISRR